MTIRQKVLELEAIQAEVRERINPDWRRQLKAHQQLLAHFRVRPGEKIRQAIKRMDRNEISH